MTPDPHALLDAFYATFTTPAGQTVLRHLRDTILYRPSYAPDPYQTAYHEGERGLVLSIVGTIRQAIALNAGQDPFAPLAILDDEEE